MIVKSIFFPFGFPFGNAFVFPFGKPFGLRRAGSTASYGPHRVQQIIFTEERYRLGMGTTKPFGFPFGKPFGFCGVVISFVV